jgi:carbamoyl-phosphate synthase small subunit
MQSVITTELSIEAAIAAAKASPPMSGSDYVKEVSTKKAYLWDPEDLESRIWDIPSPSQNREGGPLGAFHPMPPAKHHIVAYDFGIKTNILRSLRQAGFRVEVVPATTSAAEVLAKNPDGVFLSNGPGDPSALGYIHKEVKELIGKKPIFAICLGHQLLGHAYGGKTFKLKFGHRGGNQPVKDLRSGKVSITSQNHGFAIDPASLPSNVEVTHINLNDGTVEGMRHREAPVLSVQYHPEAAPGPNDAKYFFAEFANLIDNAS